MNKGSSSTDSTKETFLSHVTKIAESLLSLENGGNVVAGKGALKSISATLINFAYLMTKLIDSVETLSIHLSKRKTKKTQKGNESSQEEQSEEKKAKKPSSALSTVIGKVEGITFQLLDTITFLLPLVRLALPGTQLTLLLIILAYRLNLFRKTLAVAKNETVALLFNKTIVPILHMFHIPTGSFIQSRL